MRLLLILLIATLAGCGHFGGSAPVSERPPTKAHTGSDARAHEIVMYALGLIDTGYRFGGKNPAAGLDCSGMVSYVFAQAAGVKLSGSAADIAKHGQEVSQDRLRPGDLVFFNTRNQPYSHVGIYIGNDRFVHAPSSNGRVRTDSLTSSWFATRFEEARTYFD
jgi:cell wall-associated NlpC family hydrolase